MFVTRVDEVKREGHWFSTPWTKKINVDLFALFILKRQIETLWDERGFSHNFHMCYTRSPRL